MRTYPSIPGWSQTPGSSVYVFDKLDGSHVSCEVDRKTIMKFGRRDGLLDDQVPFLSEARNLILERYGDAFPRIVRDNRWKKASFYMEFHGEHSFAGTHQEEPHIVTLFDLAPEEHPLLEPREFLKVCRGVDHAALLYHGNFNSEIAEEVSAGTLEGMTFEGVVCKGPLDRKQGRPLAFKWKNREWLLRLKTWCSGDERLYERLR